MYGTADDIAREALRSVTDPIAHRISARTESSTRQMSQAVYVSRNTLWRILRDQGIHLYHAQRVQGLDYQALINFTTWFLQQMSVDPSRCAQVLFTEEWTFTCYGISNIYSYHDWATESPHILRPSLFQQCFQAKCLAEWCTII